MFELELDFFDLAFVCNDMVLKLLIATNKTYVLVCNSLFNLDRFPHKNDKLLKKWITAVGRENWFPSKTAVLCKKHFCDSDFVLNSYSFPNLRKTFLKKEAVPSIFSETPVQKKQELLNESNVVFDAGDHNISASPFSSGNVFLDIRAL